MSHPLERTITQIAECSQHLDTAITQLRQHLDDHRLAKVAYLVAEAKALLNSDGKNAEARRSDAVLKTEQHLNELMLAETNVTVCKERIRVLHAQLSALQTVARAEQSQWMAEPTGQWT